MQKYCSQHNSNYQRPSHLGEFPNAFVHEGKVKNHTMKRMKSFHFGKLRKSVEKTTNVPPDVVSDFQNFLRKDEDICFVSNENPWEGTYRSHWYNPEDPYYNPYDTKEINRILNKKIFDESYKDTGRWEIGQIEDRKTNTSIHLSKNSWEEMWGTYKPWWYDEKHSAFDPSNTRETKKLIQKKKEPQIKDRLQVTVPTYEKHIDSVEVLFRDEESTLNEDYKEDHTVEEEEVNEGCGEKEFSDINSNFEDVATYLYIPPNTKAKGIKELFQRKALLENACFIKIPGGHLEKIPLHTYTESERRKGISMFNKAMYFTYDAKEPLYEFDKQLLPEKLRMTVDNEKSILKKKAKMNISRLIRRVKSNICISPIVYSMVEEDDIQQNWLARVQKGHCFKINQNLDWSDILTWRNTLSEVLNRVDGYKLIRRDITRLF